MADTQSARHFILQQSPEFTTKQVVEAGQAAGLKFGPRRVQEVRKELRDSLKKAVKTTRRPPASIYPVAAKTVTHVPMRYMASLNEIHVPTPMTVSHDDSQLMALIMEKGINRCNELMEQLQTLARNANV